MYIRHYYTRASRVTNKYIMIYSIVVNTIFFSPTNPEQRKWRRRISRLFRYTQCGRFENESTFNVYALFVCSTDTFILFFFFIIICIFFLFSRVRRRTYVYNAVVQCSEVIITLRFLFSARISWHWLLSVHYITVIKLRPLPYKIYVFFFFLLFP